MISEKPQQYLTEDFLEEFEIALANEVDSFDGKVRSMINFVIDNKGKRLRPLLVHSCCNIKYHSTKQDIVKASIIVELIHIATLIHDDVIDNAKVRRNQATLHGIVDANEAILVGDILLSHALEIASSFSDTMVCREVSMATKATCIGEVNQSFAQRNYETSYEEYEQVLLGKTGKLFACACRLGAKLSNADESVVGYVTRFAENLGIAYQLYDDAMDVFGSEADSHKTLKTDLKTNKVTLPVILLLQSCCEEERNPIIEMFQNYDNNESKLNEVFEAYGIKQKCCEIIADKLTEMNTCIANVGYLPIAGKMKNISEKICNKIKYTL
jgi:octaprenyl-diphosphate synthase